MDLKYVIILFTSFCCKSNVQGDKKTEEQSVKIKACIHKCTLETASFEWKITTDR